MSVAWTIAWREVCSFFRVPTGWIVVALYLLLTGIVYRYGVLVPGAPSTLRDFFLVSQIFLIILTPAVSMRLVSEELRSGTFEGLMTAPVPDLVVILGKYLGGVLFLLVMLAPTLVYVPILVAVSDPRPDLGPVAAGYLSLVLLGMLYLSVGTLASTLTSSQTLAFVGTFLFLFLLHLLTAGTIALPAPVARALELASLRPRVEDFARGIVDTAHIAYFLTVSAWFVVLAYVSIQTRRWR
jgi:gliding motility-associated transport system permease protein